MAFFPARPEPHTYDQKQIEAVLTRCTACGVWFYMTAPSAACVQCSIGTAKYPLKKAEAS